MTVIGFCGFAQSGKDESAKVLMELGWQRLAFADALRDSVYNLNPLIEIPTRDHEKGILGRARASGPSLARVQDLVDSEGWDVAKVTYPEIRTLLQRMGTEVGRELYGESFWVDRVLAQMTPDQNYVITDVRFPNEVAAVRSVGGKVIRIFREGVGAVNSHVSDQGINDLEFDSVIMNDGSLEDLKASVLVAVG